MRDQSERITFELENINIQPIQSSVSFVKFNLEMTIIDHGDSFTCRFDYRKGLFSKGVIKEMLSHFQELVMQFSSIDVNSTVTFDCSSRDLIKSAHEILEINSHIEPTSQHIRQYEKISALLMQIIRTVLPDMTILVTDNLFAKGLDSLKSVQVVSRVRDIGIPLEPKIMFQYPSVEQLTTYLVSNNEQVYQPYIILNKQAEVPYLFMIHPAAAGAEAYFSFAELFSEDVPLCIIDNVNLYNDHILHADVLSQASYYAALMLDVQPAGPYYICGHSRGGMIAFEMAQQLARQGAQVMAVYMIDSFIAPFQNRALLLQELVSEPTLDSHWQAVYMMERKSSLEYVPDQYIGKTYFFKASDSYVDGYDCSYEMLNGFKDYLPNCTAYLMKADHMSIMKGDSAKNIVNHIMLDMRNCNEN